MIARFFRVDLDLRALAALRIALGLVILFDLLLRSRDISAFYTDGGVLPRTVLLSIPHPTLFTFLNTVGTSVGVGLWFFILASAAIGMTLGWQTRFCTVLVWVLHIALKHRNPLSLDAGDLELGLILWWTIFLPTSARYSLDARSNPEWAKLPNSYSSVATAGYLLQLSLMYFMAALHKSDPVWLENGLALYYCFSYDQFATTLAKQLTEYPSLLRSLSFAAVAFEFCVPVLLWFPWKRSRVWLVACTGLLLFHLSIAATLHLGIMPLINILMILALLPGRLFERPALLVSRLHSHLPTIPFCKRYKGNCPGYTLARPVAALLLLVCLYNCHQNYAVYRRVVVPMPVKYFGYFFRQQQTWSLFAPHPGKDDGWFVIEGTRLDGQAVDLRSGNTPSYEKPSSVAATFPNQRWRLWLKNLAARNDERVSRAFASYVGESWNEEHRGLDRVKVVRIVFVSEPTPLPGANATVTPFTLYELQLPEKSYHKVDEAYIP